MTVGPFVCSQSVVSYAIREFSNTSFCVDTAQLVLYRIHVTCVRRNCTEPPPPTKHPTDRFWTRITFWNMKQTRRKFDSPIAMGVKPKMVCPSQQHKQSRPVWKLWYSVHTKQRRMLSENKCRGCDWSAECGHNTTWRCDRSRGWLHTVYNAKPLIIRTIQLRAPIFYNRFQIDYNYTGFPTILIQPSFGSDI